MQGRVAVHDGRVELVDDFGARHAGERERIKPRRAVLIDHHAVRQRAQVGALAAHEQSAEVLMRGGFAAADGIGAAVVARILERGLLACVVKRGRAAPAYGVFVCPISPTQP